MKRERERERDREEKRREEKKRERERERFRGEEKTAKVFNKDNKDKKGQQR